MKGGEPIWFIVDMYGLLPSRVGGTRVELVGGVEVPRLGGGGGVEGGMFPVSREALVSRMKAHSVFL